MLIYSQNMYFIALYGSLVFGSTPMFPLFV